MNAPRSRRTLFYREGRSDKTYVADLYDDHVTFQWGRRGAKLQSKTFGPMSRGAKLQSKTFGPMSRGFAEAFYHRKIQEKIDKGYRDTPDSPEQARRVFDELGRSMARIASQEEAARREPGPARPAKANPPPKPDPLTLPAGTRKFRTKH